MGTLRGFFVGLLAASLSGGLSAIATREAEADTAPYERRSAAAQRQLEFLRNGDPAPPLARRGQPLPIVEGSTSVTNLIVNNPATDLGESSTQNEVSMAVSGDTICIGYNDTGQSGLTGFSRSGDRGRTWEDRGSLLAPFHFGDPVLAVHHATNTFYMADLALRSEGDNGFVSIISVARSTDGCRTFPSFADATPDASSPRTCAAPVESFCADRNCRRNSDCDSSRDAGDGICTGRDQEDKPWIAVDNTGGQFDGTVYACWSRFVGGGGIELRVSRSTDGGVSFSKSERVSSGDRFPLGCFLAVGPDGDAYVAWADNDQQTPIRFRRSRNGGGSWDGIVQINQRITRHPGVDRVITCNTSLVCGREERNQRATLSGDVRQAAQVWIAVDTSDSPFRGTIYATWVHDPPGMPDNSDVYFSRSVDGGSSWTPEIQLGGGSPTDQFEPFIAVADDGTVSVSWYDRRNDAPRNLLIDVYRALSRDGGATFEPIERVTSGSFPVPPITGQATNSGSFDPATSACYMGEYNAAAGDGSNFYYAWGDNRNRRTTALYPGGRADPDVYFARLPLASAVACVGDCNGDGQVTVDEVLTMVNIGLGGEDISSCPAGDADGSGSVTVDEILAAVNNALTGCG